MKARLVAVVVALALAAPRIASACGAAYPGGPMVCTMADAPGHLHGEKMLAPVARVSLSWSYTATTILFGGGKRADLTRHAVFAGTELPLGGGLALRFGAGGIVAGELETRAGAASFGPGATGFFGIAKNVVNEKGVVPFLQLGATLSGSRAGTRGPGVNEGPSFTAFDLRGSLTVGKTIARVIVPYVSMRAFGGPILYRYAGEAVTGTDLYKYQVAGGLSFALPSHLLDAFVEGVPFGESGGAGAAAGFARRPGNTWRNEGRTKSAAAIARISPLMAR